jgi:SAM-dependent methyltransferase
VRPEIESQREFWTREADAFNSIYTHEKSRVSVWLDRVFRKDMHDRFVFAMQRCEPIQGRSFLDVGCGNGVYSVQLARKGAASVIGLDIAAPMLDLCSQAADEARVQDRCTFVHTDLLEYEPDVPIDVSLAIGLFDYVSDPLPVLAKMRGVSRDKAIVSFPRLWTWRAPVRRLRLALKRCSVHFYRRRQIERLMEEAGFRRHTVTRIGKLHCVVGFTGSNACRNQQEAVSSPAGPLRP